MDWDNVRVFLAVARAGQFVAAARRLKLDHATVSRRVAALEAALGARLFERLTTGARLTSSGERFLAAAEAMESAFLQAQTEVSGVDVELTGDVRIGAPDGFATYYLAGALRDFVARNPGLRLQLAPAPQLTPLARREVDVVVGLDKPEEGRFVARKLTDYSLGIYASAGYLAERGHAARGRRSRRSSPDRLHRGIRVLRRARLRARALWRRADDLRMRERGDPVRGFARRTRPRRRPRLHRPPLPRSRPVLPGRRAKRAYWLVTHQDTRGLGRIRAVCEHLAACVTRDRAMFV